MKQPIIDFAMSSITRIENIIDRYKKRIDSEEYRNKKDRHSKLSLWITKNQLEYETMSEEDKKEFESAEKEVKKLKEWLVMEKDVRKDLLGSIKEMEKQKKRYQEWVKELLGDDYYRQ